jgi:UDP-glucose 4-epimerase
MSVAVVTGAAGFIGSRVAHALTERGYRVRSAGRGTAVPELTGRALEIIDGDTALIVHCAGGSSVGRSITAPLADFRETVPPFAELLERVRTAAPAARVVLLSSGAVYGDAETIPTDERAPARPISPYGHHKRMCEELCASFGHNYAVTSTIVRLFSVYGAGLRKQLLWDACGKAATRQRSFQGTGAEVRDWLHVDDAVSLLLTAAGAASAAAPIINGGSGIGTSVATIVRTVFTAMDAGEPEFGGGSRPGDPSRYVADIARATALGWKPAVALERGLAEYVEWFKGHA